MFTGEYTHGVDEKGRFIVPAKIREELGLSFMLTRGMDGCLFAYTLLEWQKVIENLASISGNKKKIRDLKRYILGGAVECEVDRQGRCLIPAKLREDASINSELHIIGVGTKLEIWDKEVWNSYEDDDTNIDPEAIAEEYDFIDL